MEEESYRTLREYLLNGGLEGRSFMAEGEKAYTVIGLEKNEKDGKTGLMLKIKYRNNRTSLLEVNDHSEDREIVTKLKEGEFYVPFSGDLEDVVFYNGKDIINLKNLKEEKGSKAFYPISDPKDYAKQLRSQASKKNQSASFIESMLERKLRESDVSAAEEELAAAEEPEPSPSQEDELFLDEEPVGVPEDTVRGYDTSSLGLDVPEELEDSGSGLLDLNASDSDITDVDTALTGEGINIPDETGTNPCVIEGDAGDTGPSLEAIEDDVDLDSFGSSSGLLDLALQPDETSFGGILDDIYLYASEGSEETPSPEENPQIEAEIVPEPPQNNAAYQLHIPKNKKGFWRWLWS